MANEAMGQGGSTQKPPNAPHSAPRRARGKQKPEERPVVEKRLWHCKFCDYSFELVERRSTFKKKHAHMKQCHPDADPKLGSFRTTLPFIEVADLPWEARCWTCSTCLLGIANGLPSSQRERSVEAHLKKRAQISVKANLAQLQALKLDGVRKK